MDRDKRTTSALPLPRGRTVSRSTGSIRDRPTRPVTPISLRRVTPAEAQAAYDGPSEWDDPPPMEPLHTAPPSSSGRSGRTTTRPYFFGPDPHEDPLIRKLQALENRGISGWDSPPIRAMRARLGDDRMREAFRNWATIERDRLTRVALRRARAIMDGVPGCDPDGPTTGEWIVPEETR